MWRINHDKSKYALCIIFQKKKIRKIRKENGSKRNETRGDETNSFGHSSQDVKRIVQGSDFQFKKLHAKAPQIKGIDSVQGAQGEGNREGGTE